VDAHAQAERQRRVGRGLEAGHHLEHAGVDAGARVIVAQRLAAELVGDARDADREPPVTERVGRRVRDLPDGDRRDVGLVDLGADRELADVGHRQDRRRRHQRDQRADLAGAAQDHAVGGRAQHGLVERDLGGVELGLRERDRGRGFLDLLHARAAGERLEARVRGGRLRARDPRGGVVGIDDRVGDRADLAELLAARLLGGAVRRGGGGGLGLGARGGEILGARPAAHERVARLRLRERGLGGGDPRARQPIVEPREHLVRLHGVALVDEELGDPALRLEREPDRIAHGLDAAGRHDHGRPCDDRGRRRRLGGASRPEVRAGGDGEGEHEVAQLGHG